MRTVVSIDPGTQGCGAAVFVDGQLAFATYVTGIGGQIHPLLEPVPFLEELFGNAQPIDTVVVEKPQVYDAAKQKGDQRDIVKLAIVVGEVLCAARPFASSALTPEPNGWKGSVPKDVMVERIKSKLTPEELAGVDLPEAASLQHNTWDAIGLGLWHLRRLHG